MTVNWHFAQKACRPLIQVEVVLIGLLFFLYNYKEMFFQCCSRHATGMRLIHVNRSIHKEEYIRVPFKSHFNGVYPMPSFFKQVSLVPISKSWELCRFIRIFGPFHFVHVYFEISCLLYLYWLILERLADVGAQHRHSLMIGIGYGNSAQFRFFASCLLHLLCIS